MDPWHIVDALIALVVAMLGWFLGRHDVRIASLEKDRQTTEQAQAERTEILALIGQIRKEMGDQHRQLLDHIIRIAGDPR